jgi:hypothetical protein
MNSASSRPVCSMLIGLADIYAISHLTASWAA